MTSQTLEAVLAVNSAVRTRDWRDAVRLAAEPLLQAGAITPHYVERCLGMVEEQGPYIVIAPGLALAHARPEDGVRALALSLLRLRRPVRFGHRDNDPVRLVFVFAAPQGDRHVVLLGRLAKALAGGLATRLRGAPTDEEASRLLEEAIRENGEL